MRSKFIFQYVDNMQVVGLMWQSWIDQFSMSAVFLTIFVADIKIFFIILEIL